MRLLGIDYGTRKIGLAKADSDSGVAVPLETLIDVDETTLLARLTNLCEQERIDQIVVGVPVSLKSDAGAALLRPQDLTNKHMQIVLAFVAWLKAHIAVPVALEDERLTTRQANSLYKETIKKNGDDALAAMFILQTYLDKKLKS